MSDITTVLYDFDGTLVDTNQVIVESWQHAFMAMEGQQHPVEEIYGTFGEPLADSMERMFADSDPEEAIRVYREYQYDNFESQIRMCRNAMVMLTMIKAEGYKSGIVTSRLAHTTMRGLKKFGIDDFFDTIVAVDDCTKAKPDPEPVLKALERVGSEPQEAVMLGDTIHDIRCAHNAGVKAVLADWGVTDPLKNAEREDMPEFTIEDPIQLLGVIRSM
ncbi:MAG: HAD-IA family hydrolase [Eubacteriaceae bacterium]|jgi:pyrophosphatase PpaX|nr:HAD-IA family hydrolase [Eubacteriaceae bacterium]